MTGPFAELGSFNVVCTDANSSGFDFAVDNDGDAAIGYGDHFGWVGPESVADLVNAAGEEWTEMFVDSLNAPETDQSNTDETDDESNQWEMEGDILLQDRSNTVGLAETEDALKPLSADAQSVLVTPHLLSRMLDVAEGLAAKNAVWLTVEHDRPLVATPKGVDHSLSTVVTPRYNTGDEQPPSEDL